MTARLPRSRLRMTAADMLPGEHAWVKSYDLTVLPDGRVWLSKRAELVPQEGAGEWPNHNVKGDYLVESTEEGLILHVFKDEVFGVQHHDIDDFESQLAFSAVVLHVPEHEVCRSCQGRGWGHAT